MSWLKKIAQPQMMLPIQDINYYRSFPSEYRQPTVDDIYQCAYCGKDVAYEEVENYGMWMQTDLQKNEFGTNELQFNIDPETVRQQLGTYFMEADRLLQEFATNLNTITMQSEEAGVPGDVEAWDVPLDRSQVSGSANALATLLNKALSGGQDETVVNQYTPDSYMNNRLIFSFVPSPNSFNTLGELRNKVEESKSKIDAFIEQFINRYQSVKQKEERAVCADCAEAHIETCESCNEYTIDGTEAGDGETYCEDCYDELHKCDHCDEMFPSDDIRYYGSDETYEGWETSLCESCLENSSIFNCESCGMAIMDENNVHSNQWGTVYCPDCYSSSDTLDTDSYNNTLRDLGLSESGFLPFPEKKITKVFIPFFQQWQKKFGEECGNSSAVVSYAQRMNIKDKDTLATLKYLSETNGVASSIIDYLMGIMESNEEWKKKYPNLKKMSNIPAKFTATGSYGEPDVDNMTITMRPSQDLLKFASAMAPRAEDMWDMLKSGHHRGSIAYARIGQSEDGGIWIINNIQTDADVQKLGKGSRKRWQDILDKLQRKPKEVDMENGETQKALAMSFWNKTLRNWQPLLLDVVIQLAKASGKELYITPMEMQKEKWSTVPNRAMDAYERIPEQMGGERERKYVKPETLDEDRWELIRLARGNWMTKLCQLDDEPDYAQIGQGWGMSPGVAKAGVMWLATLGHSIEQSARMNITQLQESLL